MDKLHKSFEDTQNKHTKQPYKERKKKITKKRKIKNKKSNVDFETVSNNQNQNNNDKYQKSIDKIQSQVVFDPQLKLLNQQSISNIKIEQRLENLNQFKVKRQDQFSETLKITKQMRLQQNKLLKKLSQLLQNYKQLEYLQVYNNSTEIMRPQVKEYLQNFQNFNKKFDYSNKQIVPKHKIFFETLCKTKEDLEDISLVEFENQINMKKQLSQIDYIQDKEDDPITDKIILSKKISQNKKINKNLPQNSITQYPSVNQNMEKNYVDFDSNLSYDQKTKFLSYTFDIKEPLHQLNF